MPSVTDCWSAYVRDHLPATVHSRTNSRYWGRLSWFASLDPEAASFPKEVEAYVEGRRPATDSTINRELALLRAALRHSERIGLIDKAPIIKGLRKPAPRVRTLTREEASKMVRAADTRGNWRERVYIRLALGSGQRPGAIMDLKWSQVDLKNKTIDFRALNPRMKKRAVVPINDMMERALKLAKRWRLGDYVINWNGRKVDNPRQMVKRMAHTAGIEDVSPHVLRHTVASLLLQDDVDILKVSRLLGHSSTAITETVYFNHAPSWLRDTTNRLKF